jgi:hypothetical protein
MINAISEVPRLSILTMFALVAGIAIAIAKLVLRRITILRSG